MNGLGVELPSVRNWPIPAAWQSPVSVRYREKRLAKDLHAGTGHGS
jgi:hypothetical protein